jgi:hypothetical protein
MYCLVLRFPWTFEYLFSYLYDTPFLKIEMFGKWSAQNLDKMLLKQWAWLSHACSHLQVHQWRIEARSFVGARVTRLGEFSPNSPKGWLFTLGSGSKLTEVACISGLLLFRGTSYALILTKNGLGFILGHFFTNSSGHTGWRWQGDQMSFWKKRPKV